MLQMDRTAAVVTNLFVASFTFYINKLHKNVKELHPLAYWNVVVKY